MENAWSTAPQTNDRPHAAAPRRRLLGMALAIAALTFLLALMGGCASGGGDDASGAASSDESTALVVYVDEGGPLLVDLKTEAPFFPTIPVDDLTGLDGQPIEAEALEVGNVVAITGDNIMLESYPGQYPGIESMRVISRGNPADAQKYAEIVDTVFAPVAADSIPVGSLAYSTALGSVSVTLDPYSYQWFAEGDEAGQSLDGSLADENGLVSQDTPDARITEGTDATVTFDRGFQSLQVNRRSLSDDSQGQARIEPDAGQESVDARVVDGGEAQFAIQPGYAYDLSVKFADGEADFAFIATE